LVKRLLAIPANLSFSQAGEDRILAYYLPELNQFYVDVGTNQPMRLSSSLIFCLKGWRGVAIDANNVLVNRSKQISRQDKCVVAAVSDSEQDVIFHRSDLHVLSTMHEETYQRLQARLEFRLEDHVAVRTRTLTSILQTVLADGNARVDLLSIDVEGHEFQVLAGLDFARYRPRVFAVELHDLKTTLSNPFFCLLQDIGYRLVGYITMNAYFADSAERLN
jgi:FkbM family methyltransferase